MSRNRKFSPSLVVCLGSLLAYAGISHAADSPVTAIDIALEPDAIMMEHAEAANARLREVYPKGVGAWIRRWPQLSL